MQKPKTSRFDAAEYLGTPEARVEYLRAALETEDMTFILDSIGVLARAVGMSQIAKDAGVGRESLYKAFRSDSNPEFATVLRVIHALGARLTVEPAPKEPEAIRPVARHANV
jgi:probable addiction module antidote protein